MEKLRQSRRRFLATLIGLPLLLTALWRFLKPPPRQRTALLQVKLPDIPVNGALVYREARVALVRSEGGLSALSLICPHLGCTVAVTPTEMVCPCHGSRFTLQGDVLKGPADRRLTVLKLEIKAGEVYVYG